MVNDMHKEKTNYDYLLELAESNPPAYFAKCDVTSNDITTELSVYIKHENDERGVPIAKQVWYLAGQPISMLAASFIINGCKAVEGTDTTEFT